MGSIKLNDTTALVTGASRGAGKGIALALGEAGATVYVTGRSTRLSPHKDVVGTVEKTAEAVTARGGRGIAVVCDHTDDEQVARLFERIDRETGPLDLLVNAVWGGNEIPLSAEPFWQQPLEHWQGMFEAGVRAYVTASCHVAGAMADRGRGLIVHVSFWDRDRYTGSFFYDLAKACMNRMALSMAQDLKAHGVTALSLSPGFMRTERVMAAYEQGQVPDDQFAQTESPEYLGRAVAHLAAEPDIAARSGQVLRVGDLAREYGFTDTDGSQPPAFELP